MINPSENHACCGCNACAQICTHKSITLVEDSHGYRYPRVNKDTCVDCGLCEKVCPMLNRQEAVSPKFVCAAINGSDKIRANSSSGGIFTMLAERTLEQGGVVFGACFDGKWEVEHTFVENPKDLERLRGAKYSQSMIGDSYKQAREFLKDGRSVLFSGTGCQIAGLKLFLRKKYDNLLTLEIACHGVPSPKVWREYVQKISDGSPLNKIFLRDKRNGWNGYGMSFIGADGAELLYERAAANDFMQCFLNDLCLRPSCTNCPAKSGASGADLLLGDFWGIESIHPEMYDNKGSSLVIAYTDKGKSFFDSLDCQKVEATFEEAYRYNPCVIRSSHESRYAPIFWTKFRRYGIEAVPMTLKIIRSGRFRRVLSLLWNKYLGK